MSQESLVWYDTCGQKHQCLLVNNSVPPWGATSWLVFILPIVRLLRARTEVSLCTSPGLSAPLNLNCPATACSVIGE